MCENTTGNANTALGYRALRCGSAANKNTAVGYNSLYNNIPTIIIDDEADHHSLNSKASKNTAEDKEDEELEFKDYLCIFVPHDTKRVEGIE